MCGHQTADLVGKTPGRVLQGPNTSPATVQRIRDALDKQESCHENILNYHADGHEYWVDLEITSIKDSNGALEFFIAFEREVAGPDHGMPVICMYCKRYKEPTSNTWESYEELIVKFLKAYPSHGICPDCVDNMLDD